MTLSVCIVTKNRMYNLKGCLDSLQKCTDIDEIVIADFESSDTDFSWIPDMKIPTKLVRLSGDFSQGKGRNKAAKASTGEIIFFLDADCLVPQSMINKIHKLVPQGWAYFPIMQMTNEDGSEGEWAMHAFGQAAVTREQWLDNQWKEWTSYGGEDNIFFEAYKDINGIRDQVFGYIHQWHTMDERVKYYKHEAGRDLHKFNKDRGV